MLKKLKALRSGNYSSAAGGKRLTFCVILKQVFQPRPSWAILQKHSLFFLKYPQVRVWEASLAAPAPFKALSALDLFWNKAGELHIPATPGAARGPCRTLLPLSPPSERDPFTLCWQNPGRSLPTQQPTWRVSPRCCWPPERTGSSPAVAQQQLGRAHSPLIS